MCLAWLMTEKFTYTDLFAGIGGFHAALSGMGGRCTYAVEIDKDAARIYEQNWGIDALGDITVDANDDGVSDRIQPHDIPAAGGLRPALPSTTTPPRGPPVPHRDKE